MPILKILSIEPTPSPNAMKLNMDESLPAGVSRNFTKEKRENAPEYIQKLLSINGVQGVFQVNDFISVERHIKADWKEVLSQVKEIFGEETMGIQQSKSHDEPAASYGEVQVFIQIFKEIPSQVKLTSGSDEMRFALPERFAKAVMSAQSVSQNYIFERKWVETGVRYGALKEIGEEVVAEFAALYDETRLEALVAEALHQGKTAEAKEKESLSVERTAKLLNDPNWEKRFAALERIHPTLEDLPLLANALEDPKLSIRRLATVYLGIIGKPEVLPHLFKALKDKSASVRRTAGDALSDIGDPQAIQPMIEALKDPNKLVRWRAARFLYEVGDITAIPALRMAQDDPEFEVSLQIKIALKRIESGEAASGTVWQQMTRNSSKSPSDR
jgi:hypothetical protein